MSVVEIVVGRCPSCGELWPACSCGRWKSPPATVTDGGDEPETEDETMLVEWVQWRGKGGLSRFHVRLSSRGALLCGRYAPRPEIDGHGTWANSFPPETGRCAVCAAKLPELERRAGLA